MRSFSTVALSALVGHAIAGAHNGHQGYHNNKVRNLAEPSDNSSCGTVTLTTTVFAAGTLIHDIQPNTTTIQNTHTAHVQVTITPSAASSSPASPAEVTSQASPKSYAQASSPHPAPVLASSEAAHPVSPPHASGSANSPINAHPAPAPAPKPETPSPQPQKQAPAPKAPFHPAAQSHDTAPKPKASHHASAPSANSGSQWCMTYSPYTSSGGCKSASAVSTDMAAIASKGFSSIRLYSTDCSGLSHVSSAASSHGLQLVLGVFISETGISEAASQIHEIVSWANGNFENVEMVVIGNEAVFNGYCSASELASFLASARSILKSAGYTGPVTTTEPLNILQENAATLCPAMDVASANIHPFFNADVSASGAGAFVAQELKLLESICPGKETYNLETGWPNQGNSNGAACPGVEEQKEAVAAIQKAAGGKSAFFSFEDDLWKAEGDMGVERSWGCGQLFGDH